jgi:hypothetical protein
VSNGEGGWQLLDHIGGIIAVGGFVVDLVVRTLQINGIVISLIPTRESLLVGGILTAIVGVVYFIIGVSKFYTDKALHYRSPIWDFFITAVLFALATTCFVTLAESHSAHHAKSTISADRRIIDDWTETAAPGQGQRISLVRAATSGHRHFRSSAMQGVSLG